MPNEIPRTLESDSPDAEPPSSEPPAGARERACQTCAKAFVPDDEERLVCPDCHDRRTVIWVVGLFMLFFCFVLLPLLIQIFGTPRPPR